MKASMLGLYFHSSMNTDEVYVTRASNTVSICFFPHAAGRNVTEDELDDMLESDNPQIFTENVSGQH